MRIFNLVRTQWVRLLLLLWFPFASFGQVSPPTDDTNALLSSLDSLLKVYKVPGAQFALVHKEGMLVRKNFGWADVDRQIPVTDQTLFRVASVSKSLLALGALRLCEHGKLSLDNRLDQLVPDVAFRNPWSKLVPLRVVHVLEHTTGFDEIHAHQVSGKGRNTKACLDADWRSRKSRWKPGTYFSYCSSAMPMVAYAIEKKTGLSFERYMQQAVFAPLQMPASGYWLTPLVQQHLAQGYSYSDGTPTPYRHVLMRASGGLHTNATELAQVVRMFLNRGTLDSTRFLSASTIARMERSTTSYIARAGLREGYGLGITTYNYKGVIFYGHTGGLPGYQAQYGYCPERKLGFVFLCNTGNPQGYAELLSAMMDFIAGSGKGSTKENKTFSQAIRMNKEWEGYYRMANSRAQVTHFMDRLWGGAQFKIENGVPMHKPLLGGTFAPMLPSPSTPNVFYAEDSYGNRSPYVFMLNEEGERMVLHAGGGNNIQVSALNVYAPFVIGLLTLLCIACSGLVGLVRLPYLFWKRNSLASKWLTGTSFLMAVLAVGWLLTWIKIGEPFVGLTPFTGWCFLFYLLPMLLTGLVLIGLCLSVWTLRLPIHSGVKVHSLLTFVLMAIVMGYLLYWGVVGFKPWSY